MIAEILSLDQFFDLPDKRGCSYELINGRLVELPTPTFLHGAIQGAVSLALGTLAQERFPHLIMSVRAGFVLNDETVQAPDVLLIERERRQRMTTRRGSLCGAPDLAIEIVSPSESAWGVDEKIDAYLAAGTKTIWAVWPKTRRVWVHHTDRSSDKAAITQTIDSPEVFSGVQIPVEPLFLDGPSRRPTRS